MDPSCGPEVLGTRPRTCQQRLAGPGRGGVFQRRKRAFACNVFPLPRRRNFAAGTGESPSTSGVSGIFSGIADPTFARPTAGGHPDRLWAVAVRLPNELVAHRPRITGPRHLTAEGGLRAPSRFGPHGALRERVPAIRWAGSISKGWRGEGSRVDSFALPKDLKRRAPHGGPASERRRGSVRRVEALR